MSREAPTQSAPKLSTLYTPSAYGDTQRVGDGPVIASRHRPATVIRRRALFQDAAAVVDREYARPLVIDDVAAAIATSRRQLQRAFAEAASTTFRAYLRSVRMNRAAERLAGDDDRPGTVSGIAQSVGYHQPAQFAKAFRRVHGVSPSEYRARARRDDGFAPRRA